MMMIMMMRVMMIFPRALLRAVFNLKIHNYIVILIMFLSQTGWLYCNIMGLYCM